MQHVITVIALLLLISACGGDSPSQNKISKTAENISSQLALFVPHWYEVSGIITIKDNSGQIITSEQVSDVNIVTLGVPSNQPVLVNFQPSNTLVSCPNQNGCGLYSSQEVSLDSNANGKIDFEEKFNFSESFSASVFIAPGENTLYFSLLSAVESEITPTSYLSNLTITPSYHQTTADKLATKEYQSLALASHYAFINFANKHQRSNEILKSDINDFVNQLETTVNFTNYLTDINDYLVRSVIENSDLSDISVNTALITSQIKVFRLHNKVNKTNRFEHLDDIDDRVLLEQFRDVLALVEIQDKKYNKELTSKLAEVTEIIDQAKPSINVLSDILSEVLALYSPVGDNPAGDYRYKKLTVSYSGGPFHWLISGSYQGMSVNIEMTLPKWRISAARGDLAEGNINASIISDNGVLTINSHEISIEFDGIDDVFNEEKAQTAVAKFATEIIYNYENMELNGSLHFHSNRVETSDKETLTVLTRFSFTGDINSDSQTSNLSIYAAELTPFLKNNNMLYSVLFDIPSSGAEDLRMSVTGSLGEMLKLEDINLAIKMKGRVIELDIKEKSNSRILKIKGLDGRWLELKESGKKYSGALYFGNVKIGDVKEVKGIPGIIFPDGSFQSLI